MSLLMPPPPLVLVGPLFGGALLLLAAVDLPPLPPAALPAPPATSSFRAALKRSKLDMTESASALTFSPAPRMILAACSGFSAAFFVCSTCCARAACVAFGRRDGGQQGGRVSRGAYAALEVRAAAVASCLLANAVWGWRISTVRVGRSLVWFACGGIRADMGSCW